MMMMIENRITGLLACQCQNVKKTFIGGAVVCWRVRIGGAGGRRNVRQWHH